MSWLVYILLLPFAMFCVMMSIVRRRVGYQRGKSKAGSETPRHEITSSPSI